MKRDCPPTVPNVHLMPSSVPLLSLSSKRVHCQGLRRCMVNLPPEYRAHATRVTAINSQTKRFVCTYVQSSRRSKHGEQTLINDRVTYCEDGSPHSPATRLLFSRSTNVPFTHECFNAHSRLTSSLCGLVHGGVPAFRLFPFGSALHDAPHKRVLQHSLQPGVQSSDQRLAFGRRLSPSPPLSLSLSLSLSRISLYSPGVSLTL